MTERPLIPAAHLLGSPDPERRLRLLEIARQRGRERRYGERTIQALVYRIQRYVL